MKNKTTNRLLFIDTETGGVDPAKHSLFSIGLVAWDKGIGLVDSIELFIKNDEYVYTKEAQKINKFNITEHEKKAIPPKLVIEKITNFCRLHFPDGYLIPLAGHNTQFDTNFLKVLLSSNGRSFNTIFSHRILDTYSIIQYLIYAGKISEDVSSSSKAFQYFNINIDNRHSALEDSLATVKLFESLLVLIN
ncbi:MAG: 3'-5' exonuclease [Dethiosulfatibacter sp.]|nr:3'-5' exonuclease [Dethiosulfatibacter sp.]